MTQLMDKRILCLANSRKLSGRCIAGKELVTTADGKLAASGPWIRPVSARIHQEVSEHERQYQDGSDPNVLDLIDVPLLSARPAGFQQENWLLDPQKYWMKTGRMDPDSLAPALDPIGPLWINGDSTFNGLNDRIPLISAAGLRDSLRLIHVTDLTLVVSALGEAFGNSKRRVQGQFTHDGTGYWLWVTDPRYEPAYLRLPDGRYALGESYLTISIGEPFNGYAFKLVAAIIKP